MFYTNLLLACAFLVDGPVAPVKDLHRDPFLRPYVQQLKQTTRANDLRTITAMAKSDLILLLHGYGTGIRNKWIRGNRDPALVKFFLANGVNDPEWMSMVLIEALWLDLNSKLNPADRASIEKKREVVARKRAKYEKLESECETQLVKAKDDFDRSYSKYGLPSKNPVLREPFYKLTVSKSGRVQEIQFFEGGSPELKGRLANIINNFKFSPFQDNDFVTLYITEFPGCRIAERDQLDDGPISAESFPDNPAGEKGNQ